MRQQILADAEEILAVLTQSFHESFLLRYRKKIERKGNTKLDGRKKTN